MPNNGNFPSYSGKGSALKLATIYSTMATAQATPPINTVAVELLLSVVLIFELCGTITNGGIGFRAILRADKMEERPRTNLRDA